MKAIITSKQLPSHFRMSLPFFLMLTMFANAQTDHALQQYNTSLNRQNREQVLHDYQQIISYFEEAYRLHPSVPRGMLESVAYNYTLFSSSKTKDTIETDATAIPRTYSVMGLTLHGKGIFRENLRLISQLSGQAVDSIICDSRTAILAYASAFAKLQQRYRCFSDSVENYKQILTALSELPTPKSSIDEFVMNSSLYVMYLFLQDSSNVLYGAPWRSVNMASLFGSNLFLLQQHTIDLSAPEHSKSLLDVDYPNALWNPAGTCNYVVGRNGVPVTNVTIHYTEGTYAGSISWFQNCTANGGAGSQVSAHYVLRSVDGQVTQMVREADKAWHVGIANGYTIGLEHEAYGNISSFFTVAMYQSSAALVRNICSRHPNINPLRVFYRDTLDDGTALNVGLHDLGGTSACTQIRGHQHFPGQSHLDPGPFWNWNYYFKLINPNPSVDTVSTILGAFTDSGDSLANYANDERRLLLIYVPNADSIALTFNSFSLETNYDFMWIYDGCSVFSPKIGRWNTQSPGRVVSSGDAMLVEFRSDCSTTAAGWVSHWQAYLPHSTSDSTLMDVSAPQTNIDLDDHCWITRDFTLHFNDTDDVALQTRFFQIMEKESNLWSANVNNGFLCDNFDNSLNSNSWSNNVGNWNIVNHFLVQSNTANNASLTALLNGSLSDSYLYDFYLTVDTGKTFSFFFSCDRPLSQMTSMNGYQIDFNIADNMLIINKIINGNVSLLKKVNMVFFTPHQDYLYRLVWNRINGRILVFRHQQILAEAVDLQPLTTISQYMGFYTEQASVKIDNMRVYRSRGQDVQVTVGSSLSNLIHAQASNGLATCKIKSVVLDNAYKFSELVGKSLKVDFTVPLLRYVNDGFVNDNDVDTIFNGASISANWSPCVDIHSGVKAYYYTILNNTAIAASDGAVWNNVGQNTHFLRRCLCPSGTQIRIGVRLQNNAGLWSRICYSDGVFYTGSPVKEVSDFVLYPNPVNDMLMIRKNVKSIVDNETEDGIYNGVYQCRLLNLYGQLMREIDFEEAGIISMTGLSAGMYVAQIWHNGRLVSITKVIKP